MTAKKTKIKTTKLDSSLKRQQKRAEDIVKIWKPILSLNDWCVSIKVCEAEKLKNQCGDVVLGSCHSIHERKIASILILREEDSIQLYEAFEVGTAKWHDSTNVEITILHELIHSVINPMTVFTIKKGDQEHFRSAMEVVVNQLTKVLYTQRYGHYLKGEGVL